MAGSDVDGSPLYVGRAIHEFEMLPAKIMREQAYVTYSGQEHAKDDFAVLIGDKYSWVPSGNGAPVPENAVMTGTTAFGKPLYVGRTHHLNNLMPGKVFLADGLLYLAFNGSEISYLNYEVLVWTVE